MEPTICNLQWISFPNVARQVAGKNTSCNTSLFCEITAQKVCQKSCKAQGDTSILGGRRGLSPQFASEILVGAPNFASKNISDKYPKFCPLNFRYNPKIGIFSQLLRLVVTELPKFFLLFDDLGRTVPQILPPNLI